MNYDLFDMDILDLEDIFKSFFDKRLSNLMIRYCDISPILDSISQSREVDVINLGRSVKNIQINGIKVGNGENKILMYSQMHGNESTGTKVIFDIINFISKRGKYSNLVDKILDSSTIYFLPMLNPDGANIYSRFNSQNIDINRDALALQSPEVKILFKVVDEFKPHFIFNLHDQRRIFNVKNSNQPAFLSLLSPCIDDIGTISEAMKNSMGLIARVVEDMNKIIPGNISKFSEEYYPTSSGDNFQKMGFPTILIEAGNTHNDYNKNIIRKFKFVAIVKAIIYICKNIDYNRYLDKYFEIPISDKKMLDTIIKDVKIIINEKEAVVDIGIIKYEEFENGKLIQKAYISQIGDLRNYYSYEYIYANKELFSCGKSNIPNLNQKINFKIGNRKVDINLHL